MRNKFSIVIIAICAVLTITFAFSAESFAKKRVIFGGGPAGGTFERANMGMRMRANPNTSSPMNPYTAKIIWASATA